VKYYESIITVSDLQLPFAHKDYLSFLYEIKKQFYLPKKTKVINLGDEADFHTFSNKWVPDPDAMSPSDEHKALLVALRPYWELFPVQDICISNHTIRPLKKAFSAGLPRAFIRDYAEFLCAPKGCKWEQHYVYNNIKFEHGENVSGKNAALNAALQNRMSTVIGHQHCFGGIQYSATSKDIIFGANAGCLIDIEAYAFAYSATFRNKPTLGTVVILDMVPHFIPLRVDEEGSWIGRL